MTNMTPEIINGFKLEEVDNVARDVLQAFAEWGIPPKLALLSLCRCITIIGSPEELDLACKIIDDLSTVEPGTAIAEVWEDAPDDWAV